jgi:hypothetical protein
MNDRIDRVLLRIIFGELIFCILIAAAFFVWQRMPSDNERVARIEQRLAELIEQVDVIGSRVTLLERPREPVMLPRHPGRIGSIDSP